MPALSISNSLLVKLFPRSPYSGNQQIEEVTLKQGEVLQEPGSAVDGIYFPSTSLIAALAVMENGATLEAGLVGPEGASGLYALSNGISPWRTVALFPGKAFVLSNHQTRLQLFQDPTKLMHLVPYVAGMHRLAVYNAACSHFHPVNARFARWLLVLHAITKLDRLPLTHEIAGEMLGVNRPAITLAAKALEEAGLISGRRGEIIIVDKLGLEAAACECYSRMLDVFRWFQR